MLVIVSIGPLDYEERDVERLFRTAFWRAFSIQYPTESTTAYMPVLSASQDMVSLNIDEDEVYIARMPTNWLMKVRAEQSFMFSLTFFKG